MTEKLYEALEVCIRALETGADLESVLKLYPQMEAELRPILETMQRARSLSAPEVPEAAMRRGLARVLQHAAGMREAVRKPRRSHFTFRRLATSLALAMVFLLGGTSMVSASSGALPGDNLYPVKRGWETVRLWFAFSPEGREALESKYEQERLNEVDELLNEGREEVIAFYGIVTAQDGDYWLVSGVPVQLTANTQMPVDVVVIGAPVTVVGRTNGQGFIEAQMVGALGAGVSLPPLQPELEDESAEGDHNEVEENEGADHGSDTEGYSRTFEFRGVVTSQQGTIWVINGQDVDVSQAEINGVITPGTFVKLEGYYAANGSFVVTKIETKRVDAKKIDATGTGSSEQPESDDNDSAPPSSSSSDDSNTNDNSNTNDDSNDNDGSKDSDDSKDSDNSKDDDSDKEDEPDD